ncbi:hypothetical protein [Haloplasma contractile]|uniref:Uncharacterized protein n=1 Tax=Haloplasma contractile SSD-17B TaxID=1033810 RepID=U2EGU7_9MOLU|nr:hypothetical protein [Haloplasma contractile]ERJ13831.1 hypothetical protein HLPCO_000497 [Haloplasma contractile SSD-17B]
MKNYKRYYQEFINLNLLTQNETTVGKVTLYSSILYILIQFPIVLLLVNLMMFEWMDLFIVLVFPLMITFLLLDKVVIYVIKQYFKYNELDLKRVNLQNITYFIQYSILVITPLYLTISYFLKVYVSS